eukprot:comp9803_c0_seq1/m.11446 comp9803_c0_seq1/g.11446  ORF comp9803_c0_seq1/g.11446 comp9803_c0_seq1/m.11446 type:complete len:323 (+) comp9803_c0_seq1:628-1596(+)
MLLMALRRQRAASSSTVTHVVCARGRERLAHVRPARRHRSATAAHLRIVRLLVAATIRRWAAVLAARTARTAHSAAAAALVVAALVHVRPVGSAHVHRVAAHRPWALASRWASACAASASAAASSMERWPASARTAACWAASARSCLGAVVGDVAVVGHRRGLLHSLLGPGVVEIRMHLPALLVAVVAAGTAGAALDAVVGPAAARMVPSALRMLVVHLVVRCAAMVAMARVGATGTGSSASSTGSGVATACGMLGMMCALVGARVADDGAKEVFFVKDLHVVLVVVVVDKGAAWALLEVLSRCLFFLDFARQLCSTGLHLL